MNSEVIRTMRTTDLIKLLANRDADDLDRKRVEIELTARVGEAAMLNEILADDFDDCAFG